jgi:hypothetical protein
LLHSRAVCKSCYNEQCAAYRDRTKDARRAHDRKRNATEERRIATDAYRIRNPKQWNAKSLLAYHVKVGNVKPQPCLICGAKAEAHHPDYDAPLDVVWLCPKHHRQTHALARSLEAGVRQ